MKVTSQKIAAIVKATSQKYSRITEVQIKEAKETNSVYVTLSRDGISSSFRISDHACPKNRECKNLVICKSTKPENVQRFVENRIKDFNIKMTNKAFERISNN